MENTVMQELAILRKENKRLKGIVLIQDQQLEAEMKKSRRLGQDLINAHNRINSVKAGLTPPSKGRTVTRNHQRALGGSQADRYNNYHRPSSKMRFRSRY